MTFVVVVDILWDWID